MSRNKSVSSAIKTRFTKEGKGLSLKQFARQLAATGDECAQQWFENKCGIHTTTRSEANQRLADEIGRATKAAKRSKKA